jgi:hypothetical protein
MKRILAAALTMCALAASAAHARDDRKLETCESYTSMTGTTTTECRQPGRKPTTCESYTSITGTTTTECR